MQTNPVVRCAFAAREEACFAIYGGTFSGKATREVEDREVTCPHRLGTVQRPAWDLPLLEAAGFKNVFYEENISDSLWDDKEKLLYGETPMFMASDKTLPFRDRAAEERVARDIPVRVLLRQQLYEGTLRRRVVYGRVVRDNALGDRVPKQAKIEHKREIPLSLGLWLLKLYYLIINMSTECIKDLK